MEIALGVSHEDNRMTTETVASRRQTENRRIFWVDLELLEFEQTDNAHFGLLAVIFV